MQHAIKLEKFVHAVLLDLLVFILELFSSATTDDAASKKIEVRADLVIVSPVNEVLRIFVAKDKKFILDVELKVLRRVDPNIWLLASALLLLTLAVVLLLHGGVPNIPVFFGRLVRTGIIMLLAFIDSDNNHFVMLNASFEYIIKGKNLAFLGYLH